MPTIICLFIAASPHSADNLGYSLFHNKAVIGKENTIIYWLIVASPHSMDNHGYSLFHSKAAIGKESAPKAFVASVDRKSTRLNSSHPTTSRMPSSA